MFEISLSRRIRLGSLIFAIVYAAPFFFPSSSAHAQIGNSISGYVYGVQRSPLADVDVELMDDLGRTISRTRTSGSGQYRFEALGSGNFVLRVRPFQTDYQEQEHRVEITSMTFGSNRLSSTNEYKDFHLRLKSGANIGAAPATIFAQEVPDPAKKLYERALVELSEKRNAEAYASLKAALEIFPRYHAALEKLGTEYLRLDRPEAYQAAEVLLRLAVDVYPKGYRGWYGLAGALFAQKKYDAAFDAIQKANEINAGVPAAAILTGRLLRLAGKHNEAEKQFLRARTLSNGSNADVHWQLALLYGNDLKRFADAARELRLYLKVRPDASNVEQINKLITEFEGRAAAQKAKTSTGS